jgi:ribosomal protein S9
MNENADEQKKDIDEVENSEELKKEMLKPIVKSKSETEKELQDLEVETTGGGIGGGGG